VTIVLRLTKYGKTEAFKSTVSNEQFAKTKEMEVRKSIQNVISSKKADFGIENIHRET